MIGVGSGCWIFRWAGMGGGNFGTVDEVFGMPPVEFVVGVIIGDGLGCEFAFSRNRRKSPISDRFTTFPEVIVWLAGGNDGRIFGAVFGPGDAVRDELVGVDVDDDEEEEEDLLESLSNCR